MKKSFQLENLDCANCAAKMEKSINRLENVNSAKISFMSSKLILDADDMTTALKSSQEVISKIERKCKIKEQ
mgnify:CR=1 FL=1